MDNTSLYLLAILYLFAGLAYLIREIFYLKKVKKIYIISVTRFMVAFVYGFMPAIVFYRVYYGISSLNLNISKMDITSFYLAFVFSVCMYILLSVGYAIKQTKTNVLCVESNNIENRSGYKGVWTLCSFMLLILGWVSLYLWTKAYGSMWTFIQNANMIRSGLGEVQNSLAFFKEFAKVISFAFYGMLALTLYEKNNLKKLGFLICTVVGLLGTLIFTMASDSRISVGFTVLGAVFIIVDYNTRYRNKPIKSQLFIVAVSLVVAYFCIILSDSVMVSMRNEEDYVYEEVDIFTSIEEEFGYIIKTQQKAFEMWREGEIVSQLWKDIKRAVFAWVPTRFYPKGLVLESLWTYNTELFVNPAGTQPTDIMSAGIHYGGLATMLLLPFVYGVFLKKIDIVAARKRNDFLISAFYYGLMATFIQTISHFQIYSIVLKFFAVFLCWMFFEFSKFLMQKKTIKTNINLEEKL